MQMNLQVILKKLFWLALLILIVGIQIGLIPLPNSIFSTLIGIIILFVWPGLLLTNLLFGSERLVLVEKLAIAFVLGIGFLIIPGTIFLIWRSSLVYFVWTSVFLNLLLTLIFVVLTSCHGRYSSHSHDAAHNTILGRLRLIVFGNKEINLETYILLTALTIYILVFSFLTLSTSTLSHRSVDHWTYLAYVQKYLNTNIFDPAETLYPGIDARVRFSTWLGMLAILKIVSQTNLMDIYWFHLPVIFSLLAIFSFFTLALTLFEDLNRAQFASLIYLIYLNTTLFKDSHSRAGDGQMMIRRILEDKLFAVWVILPVVLVFAIKYIKKRRPGYLAGFLITATTLTIIHPIGYASLGIMISSFALVSILTGIWHGVKTERSQIISYTGINTGRVVDNITSFLNLLWSQLTKQKDEVAKFGILIAIILVLAVFPLLAKQEYINTGSKAFSFEDAPEGVEYVIEYYINSRHLIMYSEGRYMASPTLIAHPLIIFAIILTLFLTKYLFCNYSAQFLFASMALPLILIFNPFTAPLLGKLVAATQLWRLRWMLPIALVIGYVMYKLVDYLQQRIEKRDLLGNNWNTILKSFIPLLVIIGLLISSWGLISKGIKEIEDRVYVSSDQRDILTKLNNYLPEESVVWVDTIMERYLPAFTSKSIPLLFRGKPIADKDVIDDVEYFYTETSVINRSVLEVLDQYEVKYLLIAKTAPIAVQLPQAQSIFQLLYQNDSYLLYQVAPDLINNPAVTGDLLMLQGDYYQAIRYYKKAVKANPSDPLTYLGLARALQTQGSLGEAFTNYRQFVSLLPTESVARNYLEKSLNIDPYFSVEYVFGGETYQTPLGPNTYFNFADYLNEADKVSPDNDIYIRRSAFIIDRMPRGVIFQHAPSQVSYQLTIPSQAELRFAIGVDPAVWQLGKGDGVQFQIRLETENHTNYLLYDKYLDPKNIPEHRRWLEESVDLYWWAGQTVTTTFSTGCGPNDDCRYDWAGWGEPRIVQPVAYDFLEQYPTAQVIETDPGNVYTETLTIDYEPRDIIFQHPTSRLIYSLDLPQQSSLAFGFGISPDVWSPEKGDGVEYNIYVRKQDEPYKLYWVFQKYIDPKNNLEERRWFDERLDLSRFSGQTVEIIFETRSGPVGDTNYDWGGWSTPVLIDETLQNQNSATPIYPRLAEP